MTTTLLRCGLIAAVTLAACGSALAGSVRVTITNNQAADGVYLTPLFSAFHDGTFDTFSGGQKASNSLERLAEDGDAGGLVADATAAGFTNGVILAPGGFPGAPVIDPGESASQIFNLNPNERFFSFASMVIPSNDLFIGNGDSMAFQIFDAMGNFTNIGPIQIFAKNVYDAGTEVNNGFGAPFNTAGGTATDEDNPISLIGAGTIGAVLGGQGTPAGTTINGAAINASGIATIEIAPVPLPAALPMLLAGLGAFGLIRRRARAA